MAKRLTSSPPYSHSYSYYSAHRFDPLEQLLAQLARVEVGVRVKRMKVRVRARVRVRVRVGGLG